MANHICFVSGVKINRNLDLFQIYIISLSLILYEETVVSFTKQKLFVLKTDFSVIQ